MSTVDVDLTTVDAPVEQQRERPAGVIEVLRRPHVLPTLGLAMLARLPLGASALLLLLRLTDAGANYAQAGAVAGVFGAGAGIGQPVMARMIDRRGQPPVLFVAGPLGAFFFLVLAILPGDTPLGLWCVAAAVAGFCEPPVSSALRGLWPVMLESEHDRHVGYAVDASAGEIIFTVGPLIFVGGIATLASPAAGIAAGAAMTLVGTIGLARTTASRAWRAEPHDGPHSLLGALRSPGTVTVLIAYLGLGGCFGTVEVSLAAFGQAHHSTTMISVLLALWSVGSVAGGVVLAKRGAARDPARRLVTMLAWLAAANAALALAHWPALLGALLIVAGAWVAPIFATASGLLGGLAAPGTLTGSFGWTVTATTIGMTIGAPVAGAIIDASSPNVALGTAAVPLLAAAVAAHLRRGTLHAA